MIKTILFDFGNVLAFFDHEKAIRTMLRHTEQSADQFRRIIYLDNLAERYECGEVTTDEVFAAAQKHGGLRCSQAEFVHAFCDIFTLNEPVASMVPGLKAAGYRLVLASNTNDAHYAHYREQFKDVLAHFDAISVSHEARARKPHAQFYEHTHGLANAEKRQCVFIDDLAENIEAAKDFGWHGVQLTTVEDLRSGLRRLGIQT